MPTAPAKTATQPIRFKPITTQTGSKQYIFSRQNLDPYDDLLASQDKDSNFPSTHPSPTSHTPHQLSQLQTNELKSEMLWITKSSYRAT